MKIINASNSLAIVGLLSMSGCVGYQEPYPSYGPHVVAPYAVPHPISYGGYGGYGGYGVAARPFAGGEFRGHDERGPGREFRDYGGYRRHERD